MDRVTI